MDAAVAGGAADRAPRVVVDPFLCRPLIGRGRALLLLAGRRRPAALLAHQGAELRAARQRVPENRVYVSKDSAEAFIHAFLLAFSHGQGAVGSTRRRAGRRGSAGLANYRRVRIASPFGRMVVLVTDGQLPWPYGRETTGYEVAGPRRDARQGCRRRAPRSSFQPTWQTTATLHSSSSPGGYIAEIHRRAAMSETVRSPAPLAIGHNWRIVTDQR